jgi:hypothetical protein
VQKVVEFMDTYSLSQEDFDTIVELSKFKVGSYSNRSPMFVPSILCSLLISLNGFILITICNVLLLGLPPCV